MDIYIPTYGRSSPFQQHTLKALTAAGFWPTLVVQGREADQYSWYDRLHILPGIIQTIAPTRDYLLHDIHGSDHILMLDDDLHFAVRREDDNTKFRQPENRDIEMMIASIDLYLKKYPHVGIGGREGGNRTTAHQVFNSRIMRVLGYRRSYMRENSITFAPMEVMEDFHVSLQVLRNGSDICILNDWVSNQASGSGAPGGCSHFRSEALQAANAAKLAARHPGFVRVVQKATKGAWGGGTRTDVIVQWKRARESAL